MSAQEASASAAAVADYRLDELAVHTGRLRRVGLGASAVSADAPATFVQVRERPS